MKNRMGIIIAVLVFLTVILLPGRNSEADFMIKLFLCESQSTIDIPLDDYVVGVVLAEMPGSFEIEALKAQAICARTYTLNKHFSASGHKSEAAVCDNFRHCQDFITPSDYLDCHPDCEWVVTKVQQAVEATRGEVITLDGELIEPVYHSTCGGHTESSQIVWGYDYCYLQGVPCPWDSESPYHCKVQNISIMEFRKALNLLPGCSVIPQRMRSTENGTVAQIVWGQLNMTGQEVREALKLPSARFSIDMEGDNVVVTTSGNGHGVGLCQYGANGMAERGKNYQQILHYYYQGITLYKVQY